MRKPIEEHLPRIVEEMLRQHMSLRLWRLLTETDELGFTLSDLVDDVIDRAYPLRYPCGKLRREWREIVRFAVLCVLDRAEKEAKSVYGLQPG